jgi:hypothetical protein
LSLYCRNDPTTHPDLTGPAEHSSSQHNQYEPPNFNYVEAVRHGFQRSSFVEKISLGLQIRAVDVSSDDIRAFQLVSVRKIERFADLDFTLAVSDTLLDARIEAKQGIAQRSDVLQSHQVPVSRHEVRNVERL